MERGFLGSGERGSNHKKKKVNVSPNQEINDGQEGKMASGGEDINSILNNFTNTMKNMESGECVKEAGVEGQAASIDDHATGNKGNDTRMGDSQTESSSFAHVLTAGRTFQKVNFRSLVNEDQVDNHDTMLPMAAMEKVLSQFDNTLVGYFLGKTIAFPNVKSYVTNTWGKFGLQKLMKNGDGVFLFKFATKDGVDRVLERGPWLIRNSPIILNKWTPSLSLNRNEVTKVPVWIKMHKVPLVAYSEDGLSLIATQVGKPIMLDAFTSSMCVDPWGRISFARALVELSSDSELKSQVTMAIPKENGSGYTTEIINVEYEWKPPHCGDCKSFGHSLIDCPKCVKETVRNDINVAAKVFNPVDNHEEGFIEVRNRKNKGKSVTTSQTRPIGGVRLNKPKPNFWRPKAMAATNQGSDPKVQKKTSTSNDKSGMSTDSSNSFNILNSLVEEDVDGLQTNSMEYQYQRVSNVNEKVQVEASKPCTSSTKVGNPFSNVGDVVVSDSDDDEVFEDHNVTNHFGGGVNAKSLLEQWREDTNDYNSYEDDYFDDCGLSTAQLKAVGIHDLRLG